MTKLWMFNFQRREILQWMLEVTQRQVNRISPWTSSLLEKGIENTHLIVTSHERSYIPLLYMDDMILVPSYCQRKTQRLSGKSGFCGEDFLGVGRSVIDRNQFAHLWVLPSSGKTTFDIDLHFHIKLSYNWNTMTVTLVCS
jgi:hypothetical protein